MSKRFLLTPWWPQSGGFTPGIYGWEHTRMPLVSIQDFYWAAQSLTFYGSVASGSYGCSFTATESLTIEPRDLVLYQPRAVFGSGDTGGAERYHVEATYLFAGPLHYADAQAAVYYPEMTCELLLTGGGTGARFNYGSVTLVPGGTECGEARLMDGFQHGLVLPLYYRGGEVTDGFTFAATLADVRADVSLIGGRWQFSD